MTEPVAQPITTCYRHPDRRAGVSCQRCDRPICSNCMVQASVGFQCPECVKGSKQQVYNSRNIHTLNRPWVTYVLIAVNVGVFVLGEIVKRSPGRTLNTIGALTVSGRYPDDFSRGGVAAGEWYRLVTSGFLHVNILHLAMNMFVLYMIGTQLEVALGRWKYLGMYMTSLLAGALAVVIITPHTPTVGASGAIYGLFGVAFVYQRSLGIDPWRSGLGAIIGINLLISFTIPGISWAGHIGGLVGGAAAAFLVFAIERKIQSQAAALGVCAALSAVFFVAAIAIAQNPLVA